MTRALYGCFVALTIASSVEAGVCFPPVVETNSPYRYMLGVADALVYAKQGTSRLHESDQDVYSILIAVKLQQSDYACAERQIVPYAASTDTMIARAANGLGLVLHRLVELSGEVVAQCKVMMDSSETIAPGAFAERQAETQSAVEETWGFLLQVAAISTYPIIRVDPATGRMSRLALTRAQRDEILGVLRSGFGKSIEGGPKVGQVHVDGAAAAVYKVISNPAYQLQAP
jgi:hypothetical protein